EYDGKGNLRECCSFVPDGKGGCVLQRRVDAAGHTLEEAYFSSEGRPILSKDGNHRWTARYDERGNQIEGANFGLEGKPCLPRKGHHRWTGRYDERDHQIEEAYFGLDGKPVARVNDGSLTGYAKQAWEYDGEGKLRQRCYFVPDGKGGCALQ